jgi:hypothetical protein
VGAGFIFVDCAGFSINSLVSGRSRPFHKFAVNIFKYDKVSNEEIRNGKKREGFIFGYPG